MFDEINDQTALSTIAQLQYLDEIGTEDILLYINSPGGSISAGLAIMDAMNHCHCDVSTICMGTAASMGAFLLAAGTNGKRFAYPNAEIMIHQPLGGSYGQASDIELTAKHILQTKNKMNRLLAEKSGQTLEVINNDCDRDYWMTAQEAKDYGIVDEIM